MNPPSIDGLDWLLGGLLVVGNLLALPLWTWLVTGSTSFLWQLRALFERGDTEPPASVDSRIGAVGGPAGQARWVVSTGMARSTCTEGPDETAPSSPA